ncbi:hypothetical protein [Streptomyces sp. NPDC127190]|uniref:hypothetical protein n=1 Tax=unclassified Streptomyces TaxID=2593676 RepID=UPI0036403FC3
MERSPKKRVWTRAGREQAAYEASESFYTATVHAPPHPHTVVGLAVGQPMPTVMEAVVSMQEDARELEADGVLGLQVVNDTDGLHGQHRLFIAYGTAVRWGQPE